MDKANRKAFIIGIGVGVLIAYWLDAIFNVEVNTSVQIVKSIDEPKITKVEDNKTDPSEVRIIKDEVPVIKTIKEASEAKKHLYCIYIRSDNPYNDRSMTMYVSEETTVDGTEYVKYSTDPDEEADNSTWISSGIKKEKCPEGV